MSRRYVIALFCGFFICIFFLWQHQSRIYSLSVSRIQLPLSHIVGGYDWLSNSNILFFTAKSSNYQAVSFDVKFGNYDILTNVNMALMRFSASSKAPLQWLLSPNKKNILVISAEEGKIIYFSVNIANGEIFKPDFSLTGFRFAWMPDSEEWMELFQSNRCTYVNLININSVKSFKQVKISDEIGFLIGINSEGNLLSVKTESATDGTATILEWRILPTPSCLRRNKVEFPKGLKLSNVALSSKGDMLIWAVCKNNFISSGSSSLWLSDIEGKNIRKIGDLAYKQLGNIRYNSEEAILSFTCDGNLFLVREKK